MRGRAARPSSLWAVRIDLHTHSTASDGTDAPGEVIRRAAAHGLDVVALTDHDTTAGWAEAAAAAREVGVRFVGGAEISTHSGGISVHLLAYLHDPHDAALAAEMERTRSARRHRIRAMADRLAADLPLTWGDVLEQTEPGATVGRPHLADALVARGVVPNRSAAFDTFLHPGSPYYVPHRTPSTVRITRLVLAAGGVPVLAHPGAAQRGDTVSEAVIEELADAGLAGLEVDHRDHSPEVRRRLRQVAESLDLLVTGSSDYHGAGKPNLLGECTTAPEVFAEIAARGRTAVVTP